VASRSRLIRGFLLAPITAPAAYAVGADAIEFIRGFTGTHSRPSLKSSIDLLALVAVVGLPIAYAATLIVGVPMYFLLRRAGLLSRLWLDIAGATIGIAVSIVIAPQVHGELISFPFPLWLGALLGLLTAEVFWRLIHQQSSLIR